MPIDLGLSRVSRLLAQTSLPWKAIHVAGTNGKGTICAYTSQMLDIYNKSQYRKQIDRPILKHGRYISPHIIDRWDCVTIDQKPVPFEIFNSIEQQLLELNERRKIGATEFELLTATAFKIFTHENVDVGVIEVGMGGRLDATNIIGRPAEGPDATMSRPPPLVTAIAKIGLDHQSFLGNTLEDIAREKAGIFKMGVPVVYDESNPPEVRAVLEEQAAATKSPVVRLPKASSSILARLPEHNAQNFAVAYRATWEALKGLGAIKTESSQRTKGQEHEQLDELAVQMTSAEIDWRSLAGRFQTCDIAPLLGKGRTVMLDGAHNAQSAQALAAEVNRQRAVSRGRVSWVMAFSDTKDISRILAPLLRPGDQVFAVEFGAVDGMPWVHAMSSEAIVKAAGQIENVTARAVGRDVISALKAACQDDAPVVVAGSLYLVGDVLRLLRERNTA